MFGGVTYRYSVGGKRRSSHPLGLCKCRYSGRVGSSRGLLRCRIGSDRVSLEKRVLHISNMEFKITYNL